MANRTYDPTSRGTYITNLPQLESDAPLGTAGDTGVAIVNPATTAVPTRGSGGGGGRGKTSPVVVTSAPNALGGNDPIVTVNVPVRKAKGSSAKTTEDIQDGATGQDQSQGLAANDNLIREALGLKDVGYDRLTAGRFRAGPEGFLQNSYAPSGNSWMWFTGGSPFPVQQGPQYVDALGEVLRNINSALEYQRKKREQEAQQRGGGEARNGTDQRTPSSFSAPTPTFPALDLGAYMGARPGVGPTTGYAPPQPTMTNASPWDVGSTMNWANGGFQQPTQADPLLYSSIPRRGY